MRESARRNAVRSTIVVLVAAASGYLTWRLIAMPFMEKAQAAFEKSEQASSSSSSSADDDVLNRGSEDWEHVDFKPTTDGYFKE